MTIFLRLACLALILTGAYLARDYAFAPRPVPPADGSVEIYIAALKQYGAAVERAMQGLSLAAIGLFLGALTFVRR